MKRILNLIRETGLSIVAYQLEESPDVRIEIADMIVEKMDEAVSLLNEFEKTGFEEFWENYTLDTTKVNDLHDQKEVLKTIAHDVWEKSMNTFMAYLLK